MEPIQVTSKMLKYNHNLIHRQRAMVQTEEDVDVFDRENEKELLEMIQRLINKLKITDEREIKILEYLVIISPVNIECREDHYKYLIERYKRYKKENPNKIPDDPEDEENTEGKAPAK